MTDRAFLKDDERLAAQAALEFALKQFASEYSNTTRLAHAMRTTQQALSKLRKYGLVGPDVGRKLAQFLFDRHEVERPDVSAMTKRFGEPRPAWQAGGPTWADVEAASSADRFEARRRAARFAIAAGNFLPEAVLEVIVEPAFNGQHFRSYSHVGWLGLMREEIRVLAKRDDGVGHRAMDLLRRLRQAKKERAHPPSPIDPALPSTEVAPKRRRAG